MERTNPKKKEEEEEKERRRIKKETECQKETEVLEGD